jgi:hypothetical protein
MTISAPLVVILTLFSRWYPPCKYVLSYVRFEHWKEGGSLGNDGGKKAVGRRWDRTVKG